MQDFCLLVEQVTLEVLCNQFVNELCFQKYLYGIG